MSDRVEQNWYPTSRIRYFTGIVREAISITRGQIGLLGPAVDQPYRLDDATVDRTVRVYADQHRALLAETVGESASAADRKAYRIYRDRLHNTTT